jgi:hypothetical protein
VHASDFVPSRVVFVRNSKKVRLYSAGEIVSRTTKFYLVDVEARYFVGLKVWLYLLGVTVPRCYSCTVAVTVGVEYL